MTEPRKKPSVRIRECRHTWCNTSCARPGLETRLRKIATIIEDVDRRCEAYDGAVGDTREEMTKEEMRRIYQLATGQRR